VGNVPEKSGFLALLKNNGTVRSERQKSRDLTGRAGVGADLGRSDQEPLKSLLEADYRGIWDEATAPERRNSQNRHQLSGRLARIIANLTKTAQFQP
jgi:hypothetical protein